MNIQSKVKNYITRYAPSYKRLLTYLEKKKVNHPEKFIVQMGYDEAIMLDAWMNTFINQGKSISQITVKLMTKEFTKESIAQGIQKYESTLKDWDQYEKYIVQKIETYLYRKKSQKEIYITLCREYPYFSEQMKDLLDSYDDSKSLRFYMQKYAKKYDMNTFEGKNKYFQALMRRGFSYQRIQEQEEKDL
ncbi:hypothetical protein CSB09_03425 [Candidatus Gracilibacteria bacterium]|nr:MAG: hypothetical protein CSB09_03425 [Candidatus Gracilibacteria bacterium]